MPKGARKGENRFLGSQIELKEFRKVRLIEQVVPRLQALVGSVEIKGVTPFCRLCADLFNEGLPVNERAVGYRTLIQNEYYWEVIGPVYYQYWGESNKTKERQLEIVRRLAVKEADKLKVEVDQLRKQNLALRSALRAHGAIENTEYNATNERSGNSEDKLSEDFDKTCRSLKLILDAADTIVIDEQECKITCLHDDLEADEGLVPSFLIKPFLTWLYKKRSKGEMP